MNIKALHPNFKMPEKSRVESAGYDLFMPESGFISPNTVRMVSLGFAAAIPEGYVGLLLPRSGVGAKKGLELNNTCGVIDADYRGEWMVALKTKSGSAFTWEAGERLIQLLIVPVAHFDLTQVEELDTTERGAGGFGSSGL